MFGNDITRIIGDMNLNGSAAGAQDLKRPAIVADGQTIEVGTPISFVDGKVYKNASTSNDAFLSLIDLDGHSTDPNTTPIDSQILVYAPGKAIQLILDTTDQLTAILYEKNLTLNTYCKTATTVLFVGTNRISMAKLSDNNVLLTYNSSVGGYYKPFARLLTISGTSITMGTPIQVDMDASLVGTTHVQCDSLADNKAFLMYRAAITDGMSPSVRMCVITLSGDTITVGAVTSQRPSGLYVAFDTDKRPKFTVMTSTKVMISFPDTGNPSSIWACVVTISGNVISLGTLFKVIGSSNTTAYIMDIARINDTTVAIFVRTVQSSTTKSQVFVLTAASNTITSTPAIDAATTSYQGEIFRLSDDRFAIGHANIGTSTSCYMDTFSLTAKLDTRSWNAAQGGGSYLTAARFFIRPMADNNAVFCVVMTNSYFAEFACTQVNYSTSAVIAGYSSNLGVGGTTTTGYSYDNLTYYPNHRIVEIEPDIYFSHALARGQFLKLDYNVPGPKATKLYKMLGSAFYLSNATSPIAKPSVLQVADNLYVIAYASFPGRTLQLVLVSFENGKYVLKDAFTSEYSANYKNFCVEQLNANTIVYTYTRYGGTGGSPTYKVQVGRLEIDMATFKFKPIHLEAALGTESTADTVNTKLVLSALPNDRMLVFHFYNGAQITLMSFTSNSYVTHWTQSDSSSITGSCKLRDGTILYANIAGLQACTLNPSKPSPTALLSNVLKIDVPAYELSYVSMVQINKYEAVALYQATSSSDVQAARTYLIKVKELAPGIIANTAPVEIPVHSRGIGDLIALSDTTFAVLGLDCSLGPIFDISSEPTIIGYLDGGQISTIGIENSQKSTGIAVYLDKDKRFVINRYYTDGRRFAIGAPYISPRAIAISSGIGGSQVQIQYSGVLKGLSNLVVGATYYNQPSGVLGTSINDKPVGVAISDTELALYNLL